MTEGGRGVAGSNGPPEGNLRVQAVLSGRNTASTRFRVLQHVEPLRRLGIEVNARPPRINKYASIPNRWEPRPLLARAARTGLRAAKLGVRTPALVRSRFSDLTWLDREVLPGSLTLERWLGRPLVLDVDDAVWRLSPAHERTMRAIAERCACVVAGNDFLADWFSRSAPAVEVVWTAVDTCRFVPRASKDDPRGEFVVGWTGSRATSRYLQLIEDPLKRFLSMTPGARLVVLSDSPPELPSIPPQTIEYVQWSPDAEAKVVARFDVGLMPLPDTDWARGKCAFKFLQYLSCAVPAVVSRVGMNVQVLDMADVGIGVSEPAEWVDALKFMHDDSVRRHEMGVSGRRLVETSFSTKAITPKLASVMHRYR